MRKKVVICLFGSALFLMVAGTTIADTYGQYSEGKAHQSQDEREVESRYNRIIWSDALKSGANYAGYYTVRRVSSVGSRKAFIFDGKTRR